MASGIEIGISDVKTSIFDTDDSIGPTIPSLCAVGCCETTGAEDEGSCDVAVATGCSIAWVDTDSAGGIDGFIGVTGDGGKEGEGVEGVEDDHQ
jgi:hypothetical protein